MRTTMMTRTREPASLRAIVRDRGRDPEIQCQRQSHRQSQKARKVEILRLTKLESEP